MLLRERSNHEWLTDLHSSGPACKNALEDLRTLLLRGLEYALRSRRLDSSTLEDFVQEALVKILDNLQDFRGESRFLTWAQKITVRTALSELRRRYWRDLSLDAMTQSLEGDATPALLVERSGGPEKRALMLELRSLLGRAIAENLTERQGLALSAVALHEVPIQEVAERLGTNRNALYKLLHDARLRLKEAFLAAGLTPEDVLFILEETSA